MIAVLLVGGLVSEGELRSGLAGQDAILHDATVDRWTLCGVVLQGSAAAPGAPALTNALMAYAYPAASYDPCAGVDELIGRGAPPSTEPVPYLRYWFGASAVVRLGTATLGLVGTVNLLLVLTLVALVAGVAVLARRTSWWVAGSLFIPFALTTDFANLLRIPSENLQWLVVWTAGAILASGRIRATWALCLVAGVSGMWVNFFDLLRTPPAFALFTVAPMLVCLVWESQRPRAILRIAWLATAAWFVGYGGVWLAKWLLVWLFVPTADVWGDIRGALAFRSGGQVPGGPTATVGVSFDANFGMFWSQALVPLISVVALLAIVVLCYACLRFHNWPPMLQFAAAASVGVIPILWFVVVRNHGVIHSYMTFRSLSAILALVLALAVAAVGSGVISQVRRQKNA